jgi:hypothetical protein
MGRAARLIADFFRLTFWPLCASVLVVLLLQPIYFSSLASLGSIVSRERTVQHLSAAFDASVLSDDGNPRSLIFKGGEQLAECLSLGIGLNQVETAWQTAISGSYPVSGDTHACHGLHQTVSGAETAWRPYFRYWHGYRVILAPLAACVSAVVRQTHQRVDGGGGLWLALDDVAQILRDGGRDDLFAQLRLPERRLVHLADIAA